MTRRAVTVHGSGGDKAIVTANPDVVSLTAVSDYDELLILFSPDAADALAVCLARAALLARPAVTVDAPTFPSDTKETQ